MNIDVQPTKELFIYMLTRDVKLEKAIIDLIDNSIDGAINNSTNEDLSPFRIDITIDKEEFSIKDNCGGINLDIAREYAFKCKYALTWPPVRINTWPLEC
jgi:DNA gyrase/topoisomerase IV subunit B